MNFFLVALSVLVALIVAVKAGPALLLRMGIRAQRSAAGLRQAAVAVSGHEMAYLEGGSGDPLVLIHGFGGEKDNWTPVAGHLTRHFRIIAPDLPPFGESAGWEGASYTAEAQVEHLRAFVRQLGLSRFHLGGNSMGGSIAGLYASRYPEELLSLWLLAPAGVETAETSELARLLEKGENPLLVSSPEEFRALMDFAMEEPPRIPGPVMNYLAKLAIARRPLHESVFDQLQREQEQGATPLEAALAGSEVPTLISWGDRDRLLHVSGAKVLGNAMKSARVEILEGVGHVPMIERARQSANSFVAFVGGERARA